MMFARDVMTTHEVWACAETADARSVAQLMVEHNIGAVPVLDSSGRLEGIVTDRDLCCRLIAEGRSFETPIRELMSPSAHFVRPETTLQEVESTMKQHKIRRLPVVDAGEKLCGFISLADLACHCPTEIEEHELAEVLESVSAQARQ